MPFWSAKDFACCATGTTTSCSARRRCGKTCMPSSRVADPSPGSLRSPPSPTRGEGKKASAREEGRRLKRNWRESIPRGFGHLHRDRLLAEQLREYRLQVL